jgi:hypothetical protein
MKKPLLIVLTIILSVTSLVLAENYTSELQGAYDYAYSIGITTQPTIDSANMYGSLIRSHMAKMMVSYVTEVLGKAPDTSLPCIFSDTNNESPELQWYITQACQLGLMGIGITAFNPAAVVTRAQFGTVLSRALRGDMYNDGDPYYIYHLQALQEAGVMTNISTPDASEVRGYVMLMMMRAQGNNEDTTTQCDTSENQLLCMIGSSDCPSECQSTTTIPAGTLQVSSASVTAGTLPAGTKYVGSIEFTATESNISINTLTFQKIGTFTKGRIEDDGVKIWLIQSLSTDASTTVTFSPSMTIKEWETKTLSVFIESDSTSDQWVRLSNSQSIGSSASSIRGGFPYNLVQ